MPAPRVNVAAPVVHVAAPVVRMPAVRLPTVNVQVNQIPMRRDAVRDKKTGVIKYTIDTPLK